MSPARHWWLGAYAEALLAFGASGATVRRHHPENSEFYLRNNPKAAAKSREVSAMRPHAARCGDNQWPTTTAPRLGAPLPNVKRQSYQARPLLSLRDQARSTSPLRGLISRGYSDRFIPLCLHCELFSRRSLGVRLVLHKPAARLPYKSYLFARSGKKS